MEWLVNNWFLVIAFAAVCGGIGAAIYKFVKMPTSDQIKAVKEWLLLEVTKAEKELGSGTGKLKLRHVYDAFVTKFPWIAVAVSFDTFSLWVDEALDEMKEILKSNKSIQSYVNGGDADECSKSV